MARAGERAPGNGRRARTLRHGDDAHAEVGLPSLRARVRSIDSPRARGVADWSTERAQLDASRERLSHSSSFARSRTFGTSDGPKFCPTRVERPITRQCTVATTTPRAIIDGSRARIERRGRRGERRGVRREAPRQTPVAGAVPELRTLETSSVVVVQGARVRVRLRQAPAGHSEEAAVRADREQRRAVGRDRAAAPHPPGDPPPGFDESRAPIPRPPRNNNDETRRVTLPLDSPPPPPPPPRPARRSSSRRS